MSEERPALATYRLQLGDQFRLKEAHALVPYLSRLGVTHLYSSPVLRARNGSTHGYDVVDPKTIHPSLGDENDFRALVSALRAYGMGIILDLVPNHMAASSTENPYWHDMLMYGRSAPYARWFDIDWRMPSRWLWGRVLLPILGQRLSRVLADDQLHLVWQEGRFRVRYFDHVLPVDPASLPAIIQFGMESPELRLDPEQFASVELRKLEQALSSLPSRTARMRRDELLPISEIDSWQSQLAQTIASSPQTQLWAEKTASEFSSGDEGRLRMRKLLSVQNYQLSFWRRAARAVNYRRFFDINDLVSLRQEDPQVFAQTHELVLRWVREGLVDGLRIDHLDGLRDPLGYLQRLRESLSQSPSGSRGCLVFIEKILAGDELLRSFWPVEGTTGYDFLNQLESALISDEGYSDLRLNYQHLIRRRTTFRQQSRGGKRRVLCNELFAFVGRLADRLLQIARQTSTIQNAMSPAGAAETNSAEPGPDAQFAPSEGTGDEMNRVDLTRQHLAEAIVEVAVALPVYRTYVDDRAQVDKHDTRFLLEAFEEADKSLRALPEALRVLKEVLLLENKHLLPEDLLNQRVSFIQRFQQLTGPAAAKGIEDTALYGFVPLASRNEVGAEPARPLTEAVDELHAANAWRSETFPRGMLCVTTHDTKRTADVRARLDVLSEMPEVWKRYVNRWQRLNRSLRTRVAGKWAPDIATEYLFYQSLIGIWPAADPTLDDLPLPRFEVRHEIKDRMKQYMLKAAREAKQRTSWVEPKKGFEDALDAFVERCFECEESQCPPFLAEVNTLVAQIARPGFWNSLSRCVLQYTSPGTPDLYQGDEMWNFALVDPDNRRPVDFQLRQRILDQIIFAEQQPETNDQLLRSLVQQPEDGRIKLFVVHHLLRMRRQCQKLFTVGSYERLQFHGPHQNNLIGFARRYQDQMVLVVVPRLTTCLVDHPSIPPIGTDVWTDEDAVVLPELEGDWICQSLFSGDRLSAEQSSDGGVAALRISKLFSHLPVAVVGVSQPLDAGSQGTTHQAASGATL
jgi:(1->4)-alpha-D-glucan 1-alpha-D-glucosylmutase